MKSVCYSIAVAKYNTLLNGSRILNYEEPESELCIDCLTTTVSNLLSDEFLIAIFLEEDIYRWHKNFCLENNLFVPELTVFKKGGFNSKFLIGFDVYQYVAGFWRINLLDKNYNVLLNSHGLIDNELAVNEFIDHLEASTCDYYFKMKIFKSPIDMILDHVYAM